MDLVPQQGPLRNHPRFLNARRVRSSPLLAFVENSCRVKNMLAGLVSPAEDVRINKKRPEGRGYWLRMGPDGGCRRDPAHMK